MRKSKTKNDNTVIVSNFTPVDRKGYVIGVPQRGEYEILLDSSKKQFGGSNRSTKKLLKAVKSSAGGFDYSLSIDLYGLSTVYLKRKKQTRKQKTEKRP